MIRIRVIWAGLWVAINANDYGDITIARGLTSEHARKRLIRKVSV